VASERLALEFERRSGAAHLVMRGKLDAATCPLLEGVLSGLRLERTRVVLHLDDVSFIDSAGVQLLLGAEASARADGWELLVTGVSESLQRLAQRDAPAEAPRQTWPGWRATD
jgi:anti-anti-sigma factor